MRRGDKCCVLRLVECQRPCQEVRGRQRYNHEYPLNYPQSKSNPQPAFCYPEEALGAFRAWLHATYIRSKFPAYMLSQTKKGSVPIAIANKALGAFGAQQLEARKKCIK